MQNRLIPSPLSDCGRAGKTRRVMGGQVAGASVLDSQSTKNILIFRGRQVKPIRGIQSIGIYSMACMIIIWLSACNRMCVWC
eukprot:COSAG05_NODE_1710_length_4237_cov_3.480667_7_plen_82_part_00